jgi:soluble lytic murein transglycosylase
VLADALDLRPDERAQVRYQIALWTVASYGADSARRLAAVPDSAYDERLHEWQAREAMARGDWAAAREAIRRMPPAQRDDPRWRYYAARMDEMTGKPDEARKLFTLAAKSPTFHGFLAADRIDAPYALCPWTPEDSAAARAAVAADLGLSRALALYRLSRPDWAVREWSAALAKMDDTRRRLAVEAAQEAGWFDRAVFALGKTPDGQPRPDELRLYTLRFPLHHADAIRREAARSGIDPAWWPRRSAAESVFDPNARSAADARGLMQVVPATGAAIARQLALPATWTAAACTTRT